MPANYSNQIVYISTGNPETMNEATLYKGGELGQRLIATTNKQYQLVRLDSGATSATSAGVVVAEDLAFWKSKADYLVTNNIAQALGAEDATRDNKRNFVAGVFHVAVTASNYCWIQQQGRSLVASAAGTSDSVGDIAIAADSAASDITSVAAGTAPTHTAVGRIAGARASGESPVDLDLPAVP